MLVFLVLLYYYFFLLGLNKFLYPYGAVNLINKLNWILMSLHLVGIIDFKPFSSFMLSNYFVIIPFANKLCAYKKNNKIKYMHLLMLIIFMRENIPQNLNNQII